MAGAHRIRVRLRDGKKSTWGKIKSQIGTDLDVRDVPETSARGSEFIVCADSQERIERVRTALHVAGLEETAGTTEIEITATSAPPTWTGASPGRTATSARQMRVSNRVVPACQRNHTVLCRSQPHSSPPSRYGMTERAPPAVFLVRFAWKWRTSRLCWLDGNGRKSLMKPTTGEFLRYRIDQPISMNF